MNGLRVNSVNNPLGIDDRTPALSWKLSSNKRDQVQHAYRVLVASDPTLLAEGTGDVWDSGKVVSPDSIHVPYGGRPPESRERLHWSVRVWDERDRPSPWSAPAHWEMALLEPDDWETCWLANPRWLEPPDEWPERMPQFAKAFTLDRPVAEARLYATGLGVYEARLNGAKVGDAVLEPGDTEFEKRVRYATYDVTDRLRQGPNTLGFMLGNGIYNVPPTPGRANHANWWGSDGKTAPLKLVAQLEVTYADGSREAIVTDESWRTALGPITFSGWYGGEDHDAGLETPRWDAPGAEHGDWRPGVCTDPPSSETELSPQQAPPIRVQETLTAVSREQVAPGVWLYDLGRNISGFPQITVRGAHGQTVRMSPAERLEDGRISRRGSARGPVWFEFTPAGDEEATWHPRTSYDGFRWIEVSGLQTPPDVEDVQALVLRADNARAGSFESSDPMLNRIHDLMVRALESNMYSELTDAPHREKLGWNEEKHLLFDGVAANFDVAAYYRQIVRNMTDAQLESGDIPRLTPNYRSVDGRDPWWSSAIVHTPWKMYQRYGDIETLRETYPAMRRYMDFLAGQAQGHIVENEGGYGDHAAVDQTTPPALTGTVAYYRSALVMSQVAEIVGTPEDATEYESLAAEIRAAFNERFFSSQYGYDPTRMWGGRIEDERLLVEGGGIGLSRAGSDWSDYTMSFRTMPRQTGGGGSYARAGWVTRARDSDNAHRWQIGNDQEPGADGGVLRKTAVTNFARGKPATQSTTNWDAPASRAVDGNTSGDFADGSVSHTRTEVNPWWEVDLEAVEQIDQISVWNRTDCCSQRVSDYYVFVSDEPFESESLEETLAQPGVWSSHQTAQAGTPTSIDVGRSGRYVRVQLDGSRPLHLAEVQVGSRSEEVVPLPFPIEADRWYQVESRNIGDTIETRIDGTLVDTTTDSPPSAGRVGFWENDDESAYFDDVEVQATDGTVLLADDFSGDLSRWDRPPEPGSQTSNALPLAAGMVPEGSRNVVLNHLLADIRARGDHLSTGEIGLRALLDALGEAGEADTVLAMAKNPTAPSYAHMLSNDATTMWEFWNGEARGSLNHFMLGAIDDWFYRYLAGIRPAAPGLERFVVAPQIPDGPPSDVRAEWPSPYGPIASGWRRRGNSLHLDVEVPVNTTARIEVPLPENGRRPAATARAELVGIEDGRALYDVGSGRWRFVVSGSLAR